MTDIFKLAVSARLQLKSLLSSVILCLVSVNCLLICRQVTGYAIQSYTCVYGIL